MGSCGEAEKMMCSKDGGDDEKKKQRDEEEEEVKEKLPGFRFHPTDQELVSFYLRKKVENKPLDLIKEIDIYKYDPWDLTKMESINVGEKEWFFFCMRGRKYRNSVRPNRVTGSGFWKATGIDKPINADKDPRRCVGLKKSLVYYRGHAGKGTKTDWMMHEFRLPPAGKTSHSHAVTAFDIAQEAEVWTLCRIFKRVPSYKKYTPLDSSKQNLALAATTTTTIKKSPTVDSCSSLDSECIDSSYVLSRDSRAGVVDDRNCLNWGQTNPNSILQGQSPNNFWNLNGGSEEDHLYGNNCWDELRSIVVGDVDSFYHQNLLPQDFEHSTILL